MSKLLQTYTGTNQGTYSTFVNVMKNGHLITIILSFMASFVQFFVWVRNIHINLLISGGGFVTLRIRLAVSPSHLHF